MYNTHHNTWPAAFESAITGDTYLTHGPNWADGIPEEAVDAIEAAYEYTQQVIYGMILAEDLHEWML